jgi:hypothetical protein
MMGQGILEAGANIGRTLQGGYESMGKSIGQGIQSAASSIAGAYTQSKDDQAKFDATKKMFGAFESLLPTQQDPTTGKVTSPVADQIKAIFADTSMSVREKNQMAPMLMTFLAQAQQQQGRERVAGIMADNRLDVANARNPPRPERPAFNVAPIVNPLDEIVDQAPAPASAAPYMIQRPPAQPQPVQQQSKGKLPKTKWNPDTEEYEFLDPRGTRYVPMGVDFSIKPF